MKSNARRYSLPKLILEVNVKTNLQVLSKFSLLKQCFKREKNIKTVKFNNLPSPTKLQSS